MKKNILSLFILLIILTNCLYFFPYWINGQSTSVDVIADQLDHFSDYINNDVLLTQAIKSERCLITDIAIFFSTHNHYGSSNVILSINENDHPIYTAYIPVCSLEDNSYFMLSDLNIPLGRGNHTILLTSDSPETKVSIWYDQAEQPVMNYSYRNYISIRQLIEVNLFYGAISSVLCLIIYLLTRK